MVVSSGILQPLGPLPWVTEDEVSVKLSDLTSPDAPATITVDQTAEFMGLSRGAVYEGVKRGDIPSLRVGRRILIPVTPLLNWLGTSKNMIQVVVPQEPPELTPRAARALLRILFDAAMREDRE
jgi:excisionase family DNA binding protein